MLAEKASKPSYSANHYLRGMAWSSSGNVIAMAASSLVLVFATRMISKAQLGAFFLVLIVTQFADALGDLGLRTTSTRFLCAADYSDRTCLSSYFMTLRITTAAGVTAIVALLIPLLVKLWPSAEFAQIAWYCVPCAFFMMIFNLWLSIYTGYQLFRSMSMITAVIEVLRLMISIVLLYAGFAVPGLVIGLISSRIIAIGYMWLKAPFRFTFSFKHHQAREILFFGGWLHAGYIMSILIAKTSETMLTSFLGTGALAVYSTGMYIPSMFYRMFGAIQPVVLSYATSLRSSVSNTVVVSIRILMGFMAVSSVFLTVFAGIIVRILFSEKYLDSVQILQILCVWVMFGIANYYLCITLTGIGRVVAVFFQTLPQLFSIVLFTFLLVPRYQSFGAGVSMVLSALMGNIICTWLIASRDWRFFLQLNWTIFRATLPVLLSAIFIFKAHPGLPVLMAIFSGSIVLLFLSKAVQIGDIRMLLRNLNKKND